MYKKFNRGTNVCTLQEVFSHIPNDAVHSFGK